MLVWTEVVAKEMHSFYSILCKPTMYQALAWWWECSEQWGYRAPSLFLEFFICKYTLRPALQYKALSQRLWWCYLIWESSLSPSCFTSSPSCTWKDSGRWSKCLSACHQMGIPDGVPGSRLWPGPELAAAAIWGINQLMDDLCLSLLVVLLVT